jgi:hypothetical protein
VLASLAWLRASDLHRSERPALERGSFGAGLRYVWQRDDLKAVLTMLFLVATFGLNFPIFIATMAVSVFRVDAHAYGLLTSMMAVGSIAGALLSARRARPRMSLLVGGAAVFGAGCASAALMPGYGLFAASLVVIGIAAQTFMIGANSTVQLACDPAMRGRVMAIYLAIALGSTPLGRRSSAGWPMRSGRAGHWPSRRLRAWRPRWSVRAMPARRRGGTAMRAVAASDDALATGASHRRQPFSAALSTRA